MEKALRSAFFNAKNAAPEGGVLFISLAAYWT